MARKKFVDIKVRGTSKVKRHLDTAIAATSYVLHQKRLEKLLLERTQGRFQKAGDSDKIAQRDPSGRPWKALSPETLRHPRASNERKLYRDAHLLNSIAVIRSNMRSSVLQSPTGGGFRIGIRPGSPAEEYARVHQFGASNTGRSRTTRVPQRRFLGIGKLDVIAVDRFINRAFKDHGL